ncbi:MAG: 4Fe-4S binding protein [Planctomycetes bacterium]|nr:4Fe-4S binding protein [Planctomycetota bacterium]
MKRQSLRRMLILISFILFPATLYYLSPALIIQGAAEGIMTGSFVLFASLFVSALFLGRGFCGWVCPGAGLQECCQAVSNKNARGGRCNWIKYFIWVPWLAVIAIAAVSAGGFKSIDVFYMTKSGILVAEPNAYIIYFFVTGLITILAFTAGRRAFCHYGCWMAPFMVTGNIVGRLTRSPSLHLSADKEKCVQCKLCAKNCRMSLDVYGMVQKGSMADLECILCGECVDNCPKKVIRYAFGRQGCDKSNEKRRR